MKWDTFATKLELLLYFFQPGNNAFKNLVFYAEDVDGERVKLWEINRQITENKWEKGQFSTDLGYDYNVRSIGLYHVLVTWRIDGHSK